MVTHNNFFWPWLYSVLVSYLIGIIIFVYSDICIDILYNNVSYIYNLETDNIKFYYLNECKYVNLFILYIIVNSLFFLFFLFLLETGKIWGKKREKATRNAPYYFLAIPLSLLICLFGPPIEANVVNARLFDLVFFGASAEFVRLIVLNISLMMLYFLIMDIVIHNKFFRNVS